MDRRSYQICLGHAHLTNSRGLSIEGARLGADFTVDSFLAVKMKCNIGGHCHAAQDQKKKGDALPTENVVLVH